MSVWKILLIGALACLCLALAMATIAIPISQEGGERWVWLVGLVAATGVAGTVLAFFMRFAGRSLDQKPRGLRS
jgi:hypothetical protein